MPSSSVVIKGGGGGSECEGGSGPRLLRSVAHTTSALRNIAPGSLPRALPPTRRPQRRHSTIARRAVTPSPSRHDRLATRRVVGGSSRSSTPSPRTVAHFWRRHSLRAAILSTAHRPGSSNTRRSLTSACGAPVSLPHNPNPNLTLTLRRCRVLRTPGNVIALRLRL